MPKFGLFNFVQIFALFDYLFALYPGFSLVCPCWCVTDKRLFDMYSKQYFATNLSMKRVLLVISGLQLKTEFRQFALKC